MCIHTHLSSLQSSYVDSLNCTFCRRIFISEGGSSLALRLDSTGTATEAQIQEAFNVGYTQTQDGLIYYSYTLIGQRVESADVCQFRLVPINQIFTFYVSDSQQAYDQINMMSPVIVGMGTATAVATLPA